MAVVPTRGDDGRAGGAFVNWRKILSAFSLSDAGCLMAVGACATFVQGERAAFVAAMLLAAFAFGFVCVALNEPRPRRGERGNESEMAPKSGAEG